LRRSWLAWVRFHHMQHESTFKRAGRRFWQLEHFLATVLWSVERRTEHMLHLNRRARRAAAEARRRQLLGLSAADDESDDESDDDIPNRERRTKRRGARVAPVYDDAPPLPASEGPFGALRVRGADGGVLTEYGYLAQPVRELTRERDGGAAAYMRVARYPGHDAADELPSHVRHASSSVEARLRQQQRDRAATTRDNGAGVGFGR
jgi:hypothetical protein